ncbi:pentatricopeptide repeat-containing protein At3g29230 [Selaginella moellendorffii]|uniref:pentatricopeptide repeat-containing protein At3g29230 n=1 Tax=Selaginella moellendorffii TaxID=88036 RepID=UPI000D1C937C|nr:pentatricopeptide repeat-containing protein At3g29230 [Selaginella moellendorffii]|eukprot:XP_024516025.1 pentatricopeptide repeat-containing protein At3g29230 [Selaginella moellendorffii]
MRYSYNAMLQAYAVNKKPDEALELFQRATTRNAVPWNIVLNAHASFYGARPCFMRYPCWDSYSTTILRHFAIAELKAAVASSDLEDVRAQYFKAFCYDDGYVDAIIRSSYTSLMHSLGTHGHLVDVAENVYKRIPSPDAAAFNALLAVYVKNGYYWRAQKLFAEGGGDRIDTRSFNIMISSLPLLEDSEALFERAADLTIQRMIQEGIEPARVTFLVWVASGEEPGTIVRDFDFVPNASHYGQVVINLARGGKFAAAVELASCLPDDP